MSEQQVAPATAGKFIQTKRVAEILGKHVKTIDRWRKEGIGPRWYQPEGPGATVYYLEHEVIAYALGQAVSR